MLLVVGIGLTVALTELIPIFFPGQPSFCWLGLILVVGAGACWLFQRNQQPARLVTSLVVTALAEFVCVFAIAATPFSRLQNGVLLADSIHRLGSNSTPIGTFQLNLPSLVYYADRRQRVAHLYRVDEVRNWVAATAGDFILITDEQRFAEIKRILPASHLVIEREPRFGRRGEVLVLVTCKSQPARPEVGPGSNGGAIP
jgi:hypothetical protein